MSGGRISWFLVGAATGSLAYYGTDMLMMADAGNAQKRAAEIREELIGVVAVPAKQAAEKVKEVVLAPLQAKVQDKLSSGIADLSEIDLKKSWNSGVQTAFSAVSNLVSGSPGSSSKQ